MLELFGSHVPGTRMCQVIYVRQVPDRSDEPAQINDPDAEIGVFIAESLIIFVETIDVQEQLLGEAAIAAYDGSGWFYEVLSQQSPQQRIADHESFLKVV